MKEIHGRTVTRIESTPGAVFDLITDIARLPEWNRAIEAVLERPPALAVGEQWIVKMHPPHTPSWGSVSRAETIDRRGLRFAYETRNTDGNPSYTKWAWTLVDLDGGTQVTVTWDVYLKTFDRRVLAGPLRKRQLEREVAGSLASMAGAIAATRPA
jgi:uncharacterized protein YndB with AHSA1/START domain